MKRFFTKSVAFLLLFIVLGAFFSFGGFGVKSADAQTAPVVYTNTSTGKTYTYSYNGASDNWQDSAGNVYTDAQVFAGDTTSAATTAAAAEKQYDATITANTTAKGLANPSVGDNGATPAATTQLGFFDYLGQAVNAVVSGVGGAALTVIAYILEFAVIPFASVGLAIAGKILDFAVQYSIIGTAFHDFQGTIQTVWTIARDTCNVFFIFVLLFIAIQQIIGKAGSKLKGTLVAVIVSALLINFSLFFTGLIVDAGNLVATALLNQALAPQLTTTTSVGNSSNADFASGLTGINSSVPISETIMDNLGLVNVYQASAAGQTASNLLNAGTTGFIESATRLILFLITMFVFLFMALLIIGRFVMLIFLLATSPVAFMGGGMVSFLDDISKDWWKEFFNQVLVAPVFMFCMLLIIEVAHTLLKLAPGTIVPSSDKVGSQLLIYFQYALIIYLLIKAVGITKKLSGDIGKLANQAASSLTGLALGAATGGTALALRQSVGRGAAAIANNDSLRKSAANGNIASRLVLRASTGTAKSSLDIRNTGVAKGTLGFIKDEGINLAGGNAKPSAKGGYFGDRDAYAKQKTDFAKTQLSRNISDQQALQEYTQKSNAEIENMKEERSTMEEERNNTNTSEERKEELKNKIQEQDSNIAKKIAGLALVKKGGEEGGTDKEKKDQKAARNKALSETKTAFQEEFAKTLENSIPARLNNAIGNIVPVIGEDIKAVGSNKAAAKKIRDELIKEKTTEKKLLEAIKDMGKADEKKEEEKKEEKPSGDKK